MLRNLYTLTFLVLLTAFGLVPEVRANQDCLPSSVVSGGWPSFAGWANEQEAIVFPLGNDIFLGGDVSSPTLCPTEISSYDAQGRVTSKTCPGLLSESFTYDAVGNRLTSTIHEGSTVVYTYDGCAISSGDFDESSFVDVVDPVFLECSVATCEDWEIVSRFVFVGSPMSLDCASPSWGTDINKDDFLGIHRSGRITRKVSQCDGGRRLSAALHIGMDASLITISSDLNGRMLRLDTETMWYIVDTKSMRVVRRFPCQRPEHVQDNLALGTIVTPSFGPTIPPSPLAIIGILLAIASGIAWFYFTARLRCGHDVAKLLDVASSLVGSKVTRIYIWEPYAAELEVWYDSKLTGSGKSNWALDVTMGFLIVKDVTRVWLGRVLELAASRVLG